MGLFDFLKKSKDSTPSQKPTIPESEKQYYQEDGYYTDTVPVLAVGLDGNYARKKITTFEERKKTCIPSETGLYVAEILLLEYCSYGTYPHPKNGYPGFWWFAYGIRDVGAALQSLEDRGYIEYGSAIDQFPKMTVTQLKGLASQFGVRVSGNKLDIIAAILDNVSEGNLESVVSERKYRLTEKGERELQENAYVPYMHKHRKKTIEGTMFGPEFNVWSINRILGSRNKANWEEVVFEQEQILDNYPITKNQEFKSSIKQVTSDISSKLEAQDMQLQSIFAAEQEFENTGDIGSLISFWEDIWKNRGLLFNGSKWTFRLPDLYIKVGQYDDALRILKKIKNPKYIDKVQSYVEKINREKERRSKRE